MHVTNSVSFLYVNVSDFLSLNDIVEMTRPANHSSLVIYTWSTRITFEFSFWGMLNSRTWRMGKKMISNLTPPHHTTVMKTKSSTLTSNRTTNALWPKRKMRIVSHAPFHQLPLVLQEYHWRCGSQFHPLMHLYQRRQCLVQAWPSSTWF